jgi:hypothetical protein
MFDFLDASSAHVHSYSFFLHSRYVDADYRFYFTFLQTRIGQFLFLSPQPGIKPETYGGLVNLVVFTRRHVHLSVHDIGLKIGKETNTLRTSGGVTVPPLGEVCLPSAPAYLLIPAFYLCTFVRPLSVRVF